MKVRDKNALEIKEGREGFREPNALDPDGRVAIRGREGASLREGAQPGGDTGGERVLGTVTTG